MTRINTNRVNTDFNFTDVAADERVRNLPGIDSPAALYFLLQMYAMRLTATTGSEFVDGEFPRAEALARVPGLTEETLTVLESAGLVWPVGVIQMDQPVTAVRPGGDRWCVEFSTPQTTHEFLQASAGRSANANAAKKAKRIRSAELAAKAEEKRARHAESQRRYVERKNATVDDPPDPFDGPPEFEVSEDDRRLLREQQSGSRPYPLCANCSKPYRGDGCQNCGQQYDAKGSPGMPCRCGNFIAFAAPRDRLTEICPNCTKEPVSADTAF
ncbi:hypothetical protein [Mycobacterium sp. TY814]|uniref:hypothetical protein n=1 Tax=unclassified Mycobacterium TaxID=2642494 RepID=UPI00274279BF|nr:hypothetical protein [Mycobacterium sp. TY814]MDP7725095.1 hypothetical protein [Mycobacterium sp. TY814]